MDEREPSTTIQTFFYKHYKPIGCVMLLSGLLFLSFGLAFLHTTASTGLILTGVVIVALTSSLVGYCVYLDRGRQSYEPITPCPKQIYTHSKKINQLYDDIASLKDTNQEFKHRQENIDKGHKEIRAQQKEIRAQQKQIGAQHKEIRAEHNEIRAEHNEIRAQQKYLKERHNKIAQKIYDLKEKVITEYPYPPQNNELN